MKKEKLDMKFVKEIIEDEGFEYAFCDYSEFEEVQDEEFHRLRKEYLQATKALEEYIDSKA